MLNVLANHSQPATLVGRREQPPAIPGRSILEDMSKRSSGNQANQNANKKTNVFDSIKSGIHSKLKQSQKNLEQQLRKDIARVCWQIAKETAKMHLAQAKIKLYEDSFAHMRVCTGQEELSDIVECFKYAEDNNQELQKSLNDLIGESEDLEIEI